MLQSTPDPYLFFFIFTEKASRCEILQHRSSTGFIGSFTPQCDAQGRFEKVQCWNAISRCWCVDSDGRELQGTRAEGKQPDCSAGNIFCVIRIGTQLLLYSLICLYILARSGL